MPRVQTLLPILAVVTIATHAAAQQQIPVIQLRDACRTCTIELVTVVTLGSPNDPVLPTQMPNVARASDGRYFVASTFTPGTIAIYHADGRFDRAIGGRGEGIGEFSSDDPTLYPLGDSILVLDRSYLTVFDVVRNEFTRKVVFPQGSGFSKALSGQYVFANMTSAGDPAGAPLVTRLSLTDGSIAHVLRHALARVPFDDPWSGARTIGAAHDGGIWVATPSAYRISQYTIDGELRQQFERIVPWFKPWSGNVPGEQFRVPPRPLIAGLSEDAQGRLRVIALVPDRDWRPRDTAGGHVRLGEVDMTTIFDSVIEVIDVKTGDVIASGRSPRLLSFVQGSDMVRYTTTDDDGVISVHIAEIRIRSATRDASR